LFHADFGPHAVCRGVLNVIQQFIPVFVGGQRGRGGADEMLICSDPLSGERHMNEQKCPQLWFGPLTLTTRHNPRLPPNLATATQKWWIDKQGGQNDDAIMERGVP